MMENMYSLNVERALLSAIIFDPEIYEDLAFKLKPHDFYLPFHQYVFTAMGELHQAHKPIEEEFIRTEIVASGKFDEVAMLDLLSAYPISNYAAYLETIIEHSRKRSLATMATGIKKHLIEDNTPADEVISYVSKTVDAIDDDATQTEQNIGTIIDEYLGDMDKAQSGEDNWIRTGIAQLDNLIDGFQGGDLVVIGARPSMGKTSLATTFTVNFLDSKHGVLFDSLEMPTKKIMNRLVATKSGEKLSDLKRGLTKDPSLFHSTLSGFRKSGLILHGEKNIPFSKIRLKARRVLRKNPNVRFWIIDHIGKMKFKDPRFLRIEIGEVTTELKAIAEEFGITVILLTQLNREVTNRKNNRPSLSDIRESGDIEQDADIVILPHRDSYYQRGKDEREAAVTDVELIVPKSRDGATGVAKCSFDGERTRFIDKAAFEIEYEGGFEMPTITV